MMRSIGVPIQKAVSEWLRKYPASIRSGALRAYGQYLERAAAASTWGKSYPLGR